MEIKDVRLPVQLQRAMAAEAEAAREARAKVKIRILRNMRSEYDPSFSVTWSYSQVIAAEGEQKASKALKEAADVLQQSPSALQVQIQIENKCKRCHQRWKCKM